MKYFKFILIPLALALALYYYFGTYSNPSTESLEEADQEKWATQTDEQGSVSITVTPTEVGGATETWKFELVLDTHSGSLDEDLMEVVTLVHDQMNIYKPISWEGTEPGGHHREGTLSFDVIDPQPTTIELKVKEVGGIVERSFRWSFTQ